MEKISADDIRKAVEAFWSGSPFMPMGSIMKLALVALDEDAEDATSCVVLWTKPGGDPLGFSVSVATPEDAADLAARLREQADELDRIASLSPS